VVASISDADFIKATGFPHSVALEVLESMKYYEECGCAYMLPGLVSSKNNFRGFADYAGKDTAPSRRYLARSTRTWAEYVKLQLQPGGLTFE
jgi:hypothetical protein